MSNVYKQWSDIARSVEQARKHASGKLIALFVPAAMYYDTSILIREIDGVMIGRIA